MQHTRSSDAFLWAYLISPEGEAKALEFNVLSEAISACENNQSFVWLHMQSDVEDANSLLDNITIPQSVIDSLLAHETRPRTMSVNGGTLLYLRGINKNPDADIEDMVSLRTWFNDKLIITARRQDRILTSIQIVRDEITISGIAISPSALLLTIISKIADTILETVDSMDEILVTFEAREELLKKDRQTLSLVRRQAAAIRRYLAPQRDALDTLFRMPDVLSHFQTFELKEQSDRMYRYVEDMDLLRERAIVLQDELRNRIAEQQGVRMYVLSMVTAIFLPLSFLTGVFGMNVGGLPGTQTENGFLYLVLGMGVLAIVMLIAMLWKRWL